MHLEYAALSDVGRLRANNEDAVLLDEARAMVLLADGMGGYNAGEVASALAVDLVGGELGCWLEESAHAATLSDIAQAMDICVDSANRTIFEAAHTNPAYAGMGTTLVLAVVQGRRAVVGHVGDSRAYRFRAQHLEQLTRDHSLLQEQLDMGLITPQEAAASGNRNLVTRAIGVEDTVLLDVQEVDFVPGDWLLLCSDGLHDMLTQSDMAAILSSGLGAAEACRALVDAANQAGGRDNVSVVLVRRHPVPKKEPRRGAAPGQ